MNKMRFYGAVCVACGWEGREFKDWDKANAWGDKHLKEYALGHGISIEVRE
jgi:hypothetical protein